MSTYDERNNLLTVTDALSNTTSSAYNSLNQLETVTNARGARVRYGYDELGRRTTVTDAQGNTFTTEYDANGNVISTTDPYGNKLSESEYNSMNLPSSVTDPSSGTTKYTYDSAGNPIKITDSANNAASYVYNSRGFTEQVIDPIQSVSRARYDESGNITELCGPLGAKTTYTYDSLGRKLSESTTSSGTVEYHYNSHGLMSELTNGRNQSKSFEYDSIGRIKSSTAPEGITEYTYDANGNVLTVKNELGTITRTFDALNRVKTYTDSRGNTVKYEYDEVGNLIKLTYPDNTAVEYTYDLNNNLLTVTDWLNRVTRYTYDKNNRLIEAIKPNGIKQVNIYNEKQRLTSIKETKETSEAETIISGYSYGYDLLGRVNFEKPLASIHAVCYTYDAVSRVISNGLVNTENSTISYREAFNYSPAGNIRTVYHNGAGTYEYDTQNKLTSFRDTSFTYDADGNMLTSTLGEFAFDSSNRLISTLTNSSLVTYTYDAEGTRIKSECGEDVITYTYDVNARLSKLLVKTEGNLTTKYVYGLGLIGEETDGEFKTYHFDLRGSTVAITDENCNVTDTFEYDTYGKLISRTGTSKTPFLYNGRDGVVTEDNGLYYMRARYYSPVLKRFINADIKSGSIANAVTLNRYAYANCNPVSNVDPLGLSAEERGSTGDGTYWTSYRKNGDGTYITAPDPSIRYYSGSELEEVLAGNLKKEEVAYFYGNATNLVFGDEMRSSLYDSLIYTTNNSKCPKGMNTKKWKKQKKSSLNDIDDLLGANSKYAKFINGIEIGGYVMDGYEIISNDIIGNINSGETDWREIGSDAAIDATINIVDYGVVWGATKLGTTIGGCICPAGGQIVGAFFGFIAGMVLDGLVYEYNVRQKMDDYFEFD